MIRIRNERDFSNWFRNNYEKLGFSRIFKDNKDKFPDFIMLENNKKMRVELEIKSSNFILHKHQINKVDKVICIKKDLELGIPIIELKNFKLINYKSKSPYSLENQIYKLFKKERLLITSDIMKALNISQGAAENHLKELVIQDKIERIKKAGITIWTKK